MLFMTVARLVVYTLSLILSVVVFGLSVHLLSITVNESSFFPDFEGLALATAVITFLDLSFFLISGFVKKGTFANWIAVEFAALSVVWVLWVSTSTRIVVWDSIFNCSFALQFEEEQGIEDPVTLAYCRETSALKGISFATWVIILLYMISLASFTIIAKSRGRNVFTMSVEEASLDKSRSDVPVIQQVAQYNNQVQPIQVPVFPQQQ